MCVYVCVFIYLFTYLCMCLFIYGCMYLLIYFSSSSKIENVKNSLVKEISIHN